MMLHFYEENENKIYRVALLGAGNSNAIVFYC
jgi:hypothetical protein